MNEQNTNPLLAKLKLPGRTFQLPSRGSLYNNGELSSQEGEVHVHPLSALAEISLKNPDLLFNGKAIESVFAECVPEIKKPTQLYGRDIDALMYFLRLVTYGPQFQITVKHTCEAAKEHSYVVDLEKRIQEMRPLDSTTAEEQFKATMPNGQVVRVHPIRFDHMIKLFQMNTGKQEFTPDDIKKNVVFNLVSVIESVDDVTDKKQIEEWVKAVSSPYHNRITEAIERTNNWGPEQTAKIHCKDCKEEIEVELPLNPISFFTE
jgi:hypothetical protein